MTFLSEPEDWKTRVNPSARDITQRKTATTRAIPTTVSPVVIFRTTKLRMLYFNGIPMASPHMPEALGNRTLAGANSRAYPGYKAYK